MKTIYPKDYNGSKEYFVNSYLRLSMKKRERKKISDLGVHKDFTEAISIYYLSSAFKKCGWEHVYRLEQKHSLFL